MKMVDSSSLMGSLLLACNNKNELLPGFQLIPKPSLIHIDSMDAFVGNQAAELQWPVTVAPQCSSWNEAAGFIMTNP